MIGRQVSRFRILDRLGAGGMGEVYLAEDQDLGRKVAIKFLARELIADPAALARFRHEARHAAELSHPGINALLEFGTHDDQPFLVLEYVPGETLATRIARGSIPVEQILNIGRLLAEALAYAHARTIIHRDIKSTNVMLTGDGGVRILDLGLAKKPGGTRITESGAIPGTIAYMSPEQMSGDPADERSDIWSLGVVLYECLAGRLPFEAESAIGTMNKVLSEEAVPILSIRRGTPTGLAQVVERCLQKDPALRFQHVDEVAAQLRLLESQMRVPVMPRPQVAHRGPRRLSRTVLIGGALAIVLLGLAALMLWQRVRSGGSVGASTEATLAVMDFRPLSGEGDRATSTSLTSLLQSGLSEGNPCRVISPELIHDVRRRLFGGANRAIDLDEALQVARKAGATAVLTGELSSFGSRLILVWRLVDVRRGSSLASRRVEGEDLLLFADRILEEALPVIAAQCGAGRSTTPVSLGQITTTSEKAYRLYTEGMEAYSLGREQVAVEKLRAAIAEDTTFALAYAGLGQVQWGGQSWEDQKAAMDKAWALRERLGVQDRLRLEAYRQMLFGQVAEAEANYKEILSRWPDDRKARIGLAELMFYAGCCKKGLEVVEEGVELYPEDRDMLGLRTGLQLNQGQMEKALISAKELVRIEPGNPSAWHDLGNVHNALAQPDSAEAAYQQALRIDACYVPALQGLGAAAYVRGDLAGAISLYDKLLSMECVSEQQRIAVTFIAAFGEPNLIESLVDAGRSDEVDRRYLMAPEPFRSRPLQGGWKVYSLLRLGRVEEAWSAVRDTSTVMLPTQRRFLRLEYFTQYGPPDSARVALQENLRRGPVSPECPGWEHFNQRCRIRYYLGAAMPDSALIELESIRKLGYPPGRIDLEVRKYSAEAYRQLGRFDDAVAELKGLLAHHGGYAMAHLKLAEVYEQMGRPADAIREYEAFLRLWSKAKKTLPAYRQASERLAALRAG